MDESIEYEDVQIPGYTIHRNDRKKHGGGVARYVSDKFEAYKMEDWEKDDIEAVWVKLCLRRSHPMIVGSIYRPTRNGKDIEATEAVLTYLDKLQEEFRSMKEVHIFGDMNCNMHKKNALSSITNDICNTLGASQIINSSTRETSHSSNMTDLIITTAESNIKESGVIKTSISDHYMSCAIWIGRHLRSPIRVIHTRSYIKFDENLFNHDLIQEDWRDLYKAEGVNKAAKCFINTFLRVADRYAKKIEIKVKGSKNYVFSDELWH